jgi:anti-sigma B factor antagonist
VARIRGFVLINPDSLNIDLASLNGGSAQVFKLSGSVDVATSPTLRAALLEAAEHEGHALVVDLTHVEFLDSSGLGALIGAFRRAGERNGTLRIVAQEGQILRLFRITGLLDILAVYPTVDAAFKDEERVKGL